MAPENVCPGACPKNFVANNDQTNTLWGPEPGRSQQPPLEGSVAQRLSSEGLGYDRLGYGWLGPEGFVQFDRSWLHPNAESFRLYGFILIVGRSEIFSRNTIAIRGTQTRRSVKWPKDDRSKDRRKQPHQRAQLPMAETMPPRSHKPGRQAPRACASALRLRGCG
jgi:hypothetical protein